MGQGLIPAGMIATSAQAQMVRGQRSAPRRKRPAKRASRRKRARSAAGTRKRRRSGKRPRLVKGSAAAKRFMARLRAKRRK